MNKETLLAEVNSALGMVRKNNPLAPSITNTVTINFVANAQLACGGSAAMVYLADEGEAMAKASKSMYINMGTQFTCYAETLPRTAKACAEAGNNWVLDPVGIGIGQQRTTLLKEFKNAKPKIIRANASEVIALASLWELTEKKESGVRGVDSTDEVLSAKDAAIALAKFTGGAVTVSGKIDLVTDGTTCVLCHGGSEFLPMITGAGCSLGGVCAVYANVTNPFYAALTATVLYNKAAKNAEKKAKGPGIFQPLFLDQLYKVSSKGIKDSNIEII
ncbi:MAG: hydroxyethylthiazole kinase [Treponema sp.]|nr:hydroxyethylthiazole kinase [Spirochaetia bacterium]MDD7458391.1 hydroxyethylthiazole kinase [Spirochaetales bacterium]MDY5812694.1 hydroxyethylthiazole kinase [Treponema sp.]MEE1181169.1 hydroxyethylthiazole kinase [Treponema sp.]